MVIKFLKIHAQFQQILAVEVLNMKQKVKCRYFLDDLVIKFLKIHAQFQQILAVEVLNMKQKVKCR